MAGKKIFSQKNFSFRSLLQSLYLTSSLYGSNDMFSYASACTFGFLFSFIPVAMMIVIVLVRILHTSTTAIETLVALSPSLGKAFDIDGIMESLEEVQRITNFEIIITITIIWMARRFFSCIMLSFTRIFKIYAPQKGLTNQILIFAGEAILVVIISVVIFVGVTLSTITRLPLLDAIAEQYPKLVSSFTELTIAIAPLVLIFFLVTACLKYFSRTKPPLHLCAICGGGCTVVFWGMKTFMNMFLNMNSYNIIYGVLSNIIVLLLEVYSFFLIFLFFAQMLFVLQFLSPLILSELYLLPQYDDTSIIASIRRMLFMQPDYVTKEREALITTYQQGSYIYKQDEKGNDAFYVIKGCVRLEHLNSITYINSGEFFGEETCLSNDIRRDDAICDSEVKVLRISESLFKDILEKNPQVSQKALGKISLYLSKIYGRT